MPKYLQLFDALQNLSNIWIFGYGSLIWNPGFSYDESWKAIANGYSLRMYQGNTFHRGDSSLPGRVATLIEDQQSYACGLVFKVTGSDQIKAALEHLHEREILNGYEYCIIPVEVNTREGECTTTKRINALTCIANADNEFYLGPTSVDEIGEQIANAKGCAGPNSDYLFKLADEIRNLFPDYSDQHLFELQASVMQRRQQQPLLC